MISTGLIKLDSILDGGIKNGTITDIFGAAGTGKTPVPELLVLTQTPSQVSDGLPLPYLHQTGGTGSCHWL